MVQSGLFWIWLIRFICKAWRRDVLLLRLLCMGGILLVSPWAIFSLKDYRPSSVSNLELSYHGWFSSKRLTNHMFMDQHINIQQPWLNMPPAKSSRNSQSFTWKLGNVRTSKMLFYLFVKRDSHQLAIKRNRNSHTAYIVNYSVQFLNSFFSLRLLPHQPIQRGQNHQMHSNIKTTANTGAKK